MATLDDQDGNLPSSEEIQEMMVEKVSSLHFFKNCKFYVLHLLIHSVLVEMTMI